MIAALIGVIVALIILGVAWWAIQQLLPLVPLGEPFGTIVHVLIRIVLVLVILWIILQLLAAAGIHVPLVGGLR